MAVTIRPLDPTGADADAHYERLAAICHRATPWHWHTSAQIKAYDASLAFNDQTYAAFVAAEDSEIIGFARIWELLRYGAPGRRYLHLVVDADHQGRGIGRRLYDVALAAMPETTELMTEISDASPRSLSIARAKGFATEGIEYAQVCAVAQADVALLADLQGGLAGLDVQPLSALKHLPDWRARLHALYIALDGDVPAPVAYTPISLEAYLKAEVEIPAALHDACFIARDGDAWIAISEMRKHADGSKRLFQDLTGVCPAYRRRGIASGLKAVCVQWARAQGYAEIVTWNDEANAGMLAANAKVGFERVGAAHLLIKPLGAAISGAAISGAAISGAAAAQPEAQQAEPDEPSR
ncbi:MAG: mycothiol synthase [Bradymonadia bacterium]|jgi:mycothiol synthase